MTRGRWLGVFWIGIGVAIAATGTLLGGGSEVPLVAAGSFFLGVGVAKME